MNDQQNQTEAACGGSALTAELATMSAEELTERVLAMEGAVQRVMAILSMALPHTDRQLSAMNDEWGRIIKDIERDHAKVVNASGKPTAL